MPLSAAHLKAIDRLERELLEAQYQARRLSLWLTLRFSPDQFGYPTGEEALWDDPESAPYIQKTHSVRAIIDFPAILNSLLDQSRTEKHLRTRWEI